MSVHQSHHAAVRAVHLLIQKKPFDLAKTVQRVLNYFVPPPDPARHRNSQQTSTPGLEYNSRQSMYRLRQLVYALANNERYATKDRKFFRAKLNPWQEHLLLHFEMLEPFPSYMYGEDEVYSFLWGEDWKEKLDLKKGHSWGNSAVLAKWAREFGFSFAELRYFVRGFQIDVEPFAPKAVSSAEKLFKVNAERILKITGCNQETCLRPRTVKMRLFPLSARPGDPAYPSFVDRPAAQVTEAEATDPARWFSVSGLDTSTEDYVDKFKKLLKFHTGAEEAEPDYGDSKSTPRPRAPPPLSRPVTASTANTNTVDLLRARHDIQQQAGEIDRLQRQLAQLRQADILRQQRETELLRARTELAELRREDEDRQQQATEIVRLQRQLADLRRSDQTHRQQADELTRLQTQLDQHRRAEEARAEREKALKRAEQDVKAKADRCRMTLEMFATKEKDAAEKAKGLEKREEELQEKEEARKKQEEELKKREESLNERKREIEGERSRRDEEERLDASGSANDFNMTHNNAWKDRTQNHSVDDAQAVQGTDIEMNWDLDFGNHSAESSPRPSGSQLQDATPVHKAPPSSPDQGRNMPAVPPTEQITTEVSAKRSSVPAVSSLSASVNVNGAREDSSAQMLDEGHVLPPSTITASLVAALAGQKRSATEVEEETSQEGMNKRSKVAEESPQSTELDSAISIITAATAAVSTTPSVPSPPASSTDITAAASLANLSQQELVSIRALLGSKRSDPPTSAIAKELVTDEKEEAAFGRVRVGLENMAEAVREMERGYEVSMRIGRKADGRFTCSAPEENMLAGTSDLQSVEDVFSPTQETALQSKLTAASEEAKALAEGESLVFKATRKVNGRLLYAIVVE